MVEGGGVGEAGGGANVDCNGWGGSGGIGGMGPGDGVSSGADGASGGDGVASRRVCGRGGRGGSGGGKPEVNGISTSRSAI